MRQLKREKCTFYAFCRNRTLDADSLWFLTIRRWDRSRRTFLNDMWVFFLTQPVRVTFITDYSWSTLIVLAMNQTNWRLRDIMPAWFSFVCANVSAHLHVYRTIPSIRESPRN